MACVLPFRGTSINGTEPYRLFFLSYNPLKRTGIANLIPFVSRTGQIDGLAVSLGVWLARRAMAKIEIMR